MALVQTCKCEECGLQKSFANHWVMIIERKGSLTVLPVWDEKQIRRTRHFCGRAHASRYVERWIGNPGMALLPDVVSEAESNRFTGFSRSDDERADERKAEQMLMLDENGEETSSARIIPNIVPHAAARVVHPPLLQSVPTPPACVLPPALSYVAPASYAREMRMML